MTSIVLLPQLFLPLSAVGLGRFVISLDNPHQDFHDPSHVVNAEITEKVLADYTGLQDSTQQRSASSQLTSLLSSSFSKRLRTSIHITTTQSKTYYLNNAGQWFKDAIQSVNTQRWIERIIDEGEDIYVVVAYHTLLDARISEKSGGQRDTGGELAIPLSTALTASGICVPLNLADPGLSAFSGHMESEERQFVAPGEQIYAVQYRKVRWSWFSSKKVDKLTLAKKAWWERYDRSRSTQTEIKDLIEVDLEDETLLEGISDELATEFAKVLK